MTNVPNEDPVGVPGRQDVRGDHDPDGKCAAELGSAAGSSLGASLGASLGSTLDATPGPTPTSPPRDGRAARMKRRSGQDPGPALPDHLVLLDQAIQTVAGAAARPQFHRAALERAGLTSESFADHPARRVDPALYGVLLALHGRGMPSPHSLAVRLGITGSTVSHHLARLERRGLLRRGRYWADGRVMAPTLTPDGVDAFITLRTARLSLLDELVAKWDPEDVGELARLMGRLGSAFRVLNWERQRVDDERRSKRRHERLAAASAEQQDEPRDDRAAYWCAGW